MGFIFGLIIGGALSSSGSTATPKLGTIPFRCLSAFEASDADYRQCRWPSLNVELANTCLSHQRENPTGGCSVEQNIKWEIAGLHQLKLAMEAKASAAQSK